MRVWPIIIDSQPPYVEGGGPAASLLLAPFGTSVLVEYVAAAVRLVTDNAPVVVAPGGADPEYAARIQALCPKAQVLSRTDDISAALSGHELSDALLFVDPRCTPVEGLGLRQLMQHHTAEPRVAHHLVAFEGALDGTKECVSFDQGGQVRGIQRFYERTTWPFIAGIAATLMPSAGNVLSEIPGSLAELRQLLVSRGIVSRDVPMEGGALDLTNEYGLLSANERFILDATANGSDTDVPNSTVYVGAGHQIDPSARLMGPVVVHAGASIEAGATVLGPAVIGRGATVASGSVVAHAVVGAEALVASNSVVRDRAWFTSSAGDGTAHGHQAWGMSFTERLARLSVDTHGTAAPAGHADQAGFARSLAFKRALDIFVAAFGLLITSPILILAAIAVRLESKGPIFYGDRREGIGGVVFSCWKFRTMFTGAHLAQRDLKALDQTDGPHFKVDRDPRVTRVGRILRALNADEIPQLFNVLRGQMSLVGPRPSPFRENQVCVPWRAARLSVRPGITGFWQVCRHNRAAGDFHQWIEYDLLYVQHLSFALDLKILAATFLTLGGKVAHVPASWLVGGSDPVEEIVESELLEDEREAQVA
jgi:lipopolysaccharide/colanic/teichoic acid biosynthesis glycosyltransferase